MKQLTAIDTVMAVLVCLFAILLLVPVSATGRDRVKQMVCRANLLKYGIASDMYLADNDNRLPNPWQSIYDSCQGRHPPGECPPNSSHTSFPGEINRFCRWHDKWYDLSVHPEYGTALWLYIQDMNVLSCPTFRRLGIEIGIYHSSHNSAIPQFDIQFSYSTNARIGPGTKWERSTQITNPSEVFLWAEENLWPLDASRGFNPPLSGWILNDTALIFASRDSISGVDCLASFHQAPAGNLDAGVSNVLFVDGHVDTAPPQDSIKLGWPEDTP